jgi:hypothetical protein
MISPFNLGKPLDEILNCKGDVVYQLAWDSGGPGAGAHREIVFRWHGVYWVRDSDRGIIGPYETLKACLRSHECLTTITEATTEIFCSESELSRVSLRKFLRVALDESVVEFQWDGVSVRAHRSGIITFVRSSKTVQQRAFHSMYPNKDSRKHPREPEFLWSTSFRRTANDKDSRPCFEMDASTVKGSSIGLRSPVQFSATAVISYLDGVHLPTMTLVERPPPSVSVLSYSFFDGGVECDFTSARSKRKYLAMRIFGFEAFRWLMYALRLTQPQRLRGESRIPAHYELESRFEWRTLRALR